AKMAAAWIGLTVTKMAANDPSRNPAGSGAMALDRARWAAMGQTTGSNPRAPLQLLESGGLECGGRHERGDRRDGHGAGPVVGADGPRRARVGPRRPERQQGRDQDRSPGGPVGHRGT